MDRQRRLGEISRTLQETSDIITQGYYQRQGAYARVFHNWVQALRARIDLVGQDGSVYNVPNLYAYQYWRTPNATVVGTGMLFSPDPTWEPLQPAGKVFWWGMGVGSAGIANPHPPPEC